MLQKIRKRPKTIVIRIIVRMTIFKSVHMAFYVNTSWACALLLFFTFLPSLKQMTNNSINSFLTSVNLFDLVFLPELNIWHLSYFLPELKQNNSSVELIWEKSYAFVAYVSVQGERLKKDLRERVINKTLLSLNSV
jgi:hypothetical protein